MQFTVVPATERDSEFVAHFEPDRARLRKAQMMRVGWATTADKTGLRSNEFQVSLIAYPFWLSDRELAFVDLLRLVRIVRCKSGGCCRGLREGFGLRDGCGPCVWKEVFARAVVPSAVVVRWTRDRGGIIGMQAKALFLAGWGQRRGGEMSCRAG